MNGFSGIAIIAIVFSILPTTAKEVIYGKYYSLKNNSKTGKQEKFYGDNAYYIYVPPENMEQTTNPVEYTHPGQKAPKLAPVVMHFYGCGWRNCGEPWTSVKYPGNVITDLLSKGIAAISVGYRRITTHYWYDDETRPNIPSPEELIHIDEEGRLVLDMQGRTFSDYYVRICRHEFITKSMFDAATAMSHIVANAYVYGVDLNRLVFWAYSAGGSLAQYLSHVHHQWNVDAFTPLGLVYRSSMLDLPTANLLDQVWFDLQNSVNDNYRTHLKELIKFEDCWWTVGSGCRDPRFNAQLEAGFPYEICNYTWHERTVRRFCGTGFHHTTLGDLVGLQTWNRDDPEVGLGMEKIWYHSKNMQKHTPNPYYVLLYNLKSEDMGLLHSSLYVPTFKQAMTEAGVFFTAYYDTHPLMKEFNETKGIVKDVAMFGQTHVLKYHSNHGWRELLEQASITPVGDVQEFIRYICFVLTQPGCSPALEASVKTGSFAASQRKLYV